MILPALGAPRAESIMRRSARFTVEAQGLLRGRTPITTHVKMFDNLANQFVHGARPVNNQVGRRW